MPSKQSSKAHQRDEEEDNDARRSRAAKKSSHVREGEMGRRWVHKSEREEEMGTRCTFHLKKYPGVFFSINKICWVHLASANEESSLELLLPQWVLLLALIISKFQNFSSPKTIMES